MAQVIKVVMQCHDYYVSKLINLNKEKEKKKTINNEKNYSVLY
jgi:hypothetical protein